MGCDIHIFSETQNTDGKWICDQSLVCDYTNKGDFADLSILPSLSSKSAERDYVFFGFLAGVRHFVNYPLSDSPRGLPQDVSATVETYIDKVWGSDAHSHSYATKAELQKKLVELILLNDSDMSRIAVKLSHIINLLTNPDPNKQRIVFFFDN